MVSRIVTDFFRLSSITCNQTCTVSDDLYLADIIPQSNNGVMEAEKRRTELNFLEHSFPYTRQVSFRFPTRKLGQMTLDVMHVSFKVY